VYGTRYAWKSTVVSAFLMACLFGSAVHALAQNRDPNGLYGPSSQPGAGQRHKSEHVLEARDRVTGQIVGKTLDRVVFIDVLELLPYDGPGGTYIYPGLGPYSYTLLNENDGVGNHVRLGIVERPSDAGLMGVWHFDGNALDSSGQGHHGTISNASHITQTGGVSGSSYHFDGLGDIDVGNLDFSGGEYTVSLWERTTYPGGYGDYRMMIDKGDAGPGDSTFELVMAGSQRVRAATLRCIRSGPGEVRSSIRTPKVRRRVSTAVMANGTW
jgi:hypothetical protein